MVRQKFWILALGIICLVLPWRVSAAVTISSFGAKWQGNSVVVTWKTGSELNNTGFNILRSTSANGNFTKVNYTPAQFGSISGASYSFTDSAVTPGTTYYYRLQSIDTSGNVDTYSQTVSAAPSATPTATAAPATATRTPTATATNAPNMPTSTPAPPTATPPPQFTPTRTRTPTVTTTNPPNVPTSTPAPPTATATTPPPFTPTRTRTLPPGLPSPTPAPPTPTMRVAYVVQPSATRASVSAPAAPSTAPPEPTRVAIAIKEPEPEATEESTDVDTVAESNESDVRARQLIVGAMILGMGVLGAGGVVLGLVAVYLAFRR